MDNKLDKIADDIGEINQTLVRHELLHDRNTKSLEEHMARTDALEALLTIEMTPVKAHMSFIRGCIWAITGMGALLFALQQMGILRKIFG
jgi:hypothetical protein